MHYIYPPRIKTVLPPSGTVSFEHMNQFMAQVKLNGSCMMLYIHRNVLLTYNRHKELMAHKMDKRELLALNPTDTYMVLVGEYMNKNQTDENGEPWNHKFVIFDILVYEGKHLIGKTFAERFELLRELYPDNPVKKHLHQISENCFRVDSFDNNFEEVFQEVTPHQMYEGIVLKKKNSRLQNGTTELNNHSSQFKVRKPTKNYKF